MEQQQELFSKWDEPEEIIKITRNVEVLRALSSFLMCTQQDLIDSLKLRASSSAFIDVIRDKTGGKVRKEYNFGYNSFKIPKSGGGLRQINDPAPVLKNIQKMLLNRLRQIPFSIAVTGGEPKSGIRQNVKPHIQNKFVITMDLKDAFPSTTGNRVYSNLNGYLEKQLELSYPNLSEEEREKFKQAIITFVIKDNQLPQGSPTSTHLLNLVLAKTDSEIFKLVYSEEAGLHLPKFTRYVDDLTISFKAFKDFIEPWRIINGIGKSVASILSDTEKTDLSKKIIEIEKLIAGIKQTKITINEKAEANVIRQKLAEIRKGLLELKEYSMQNELTELYVKIDNMVGIIDLVPRDFTYEKGMEKIKEQVAKIISRNGWKVKTSKTKSWTPSSSKVKEITGVTIGTDGRLGIPSDKMEMYIEFAKTCAESPEKLPKEFKDRKTKKPNPEKIAQTLQGIRTFIVDIKGAAPKRFEKYYINARNKFFDGWRASKASHPVRLGEGY